MCSVENNKTTISSMNNFNNMTRLGSQMSKFNRVNINDIKTVMIFIFLKYLIDKAIITKLNKNKIKREMIKFSE